MEETFKYIVEINEGSSFIRQILANSSLRQVKAASRPFITLKECETSMLILMNQIAKVESKKSASSYVVVRQVNPIHTDTKAVSNWDPHVVMKAFVAEAEHLKRGKVSPLITAELYSSEEWAFIH